MVTLKYRQGRISSWFFPHINESYFVLRISLWTSGLLYIWYVSINTLQSLFIVFFDAQNFPFLSSWLATSWLLWFDSFFCSWTQYVPGSSCTLSVWDLKWAILPRSPKFFLLKVVFINYTWGNRDTYCYRITEYLSFSVENTRKYVIFFVRKYELRLIFPKWM